MNIQAAKLSLINGKQYHTPSEMDHAEVRDGQLYVMVEVSAPMAVWDNVSRELVARVIETFAISQLTDSQALDEAATDINNYLIAHNDILPQNKQVWAGVNALFIRDNQLFLAQAGPALTYIIREQLVTRYPPSNPKQMAIPLGEQHDLPCRLGELELQPNDIIVLTASHLPFRVSEQVVHDAMQHDTVDEIMVNLVQMAGNEDFSAFAVQYEPMPEAAAHRSTPVVIAPPTIPLQLVDIDEPSPAVADVEKEEASQNKGQANEPDERIGSTTPANQVTKPTTEVDYAIEDRDEDRDKSLKPPPAQRQGQSLMDNISAYVSQLPDYEPSRATPSPRSNKLQQDAQKSEPVSYSAPAPVTPARQAPAEAAAGVSRSRSYSYTAAKKAAPSPSYQATQPPASEPRARQANRASSRRRHDPFPSADSNASAVNQPTAAASPTESDSGRRRQNATSLSLSRRIGIAILALLAWGLGALSAAVGGLHQWLTPRMAQMAPRLDRMAHTTWHGTQDLLSTAWQSLRQLLPGYQKRPRKAKRPLITPPTGDGSEFMRLATIAIPIVLLLIGFAFWTIRGETEPVLAQTEAETEVEAQEEEATAEAAQNAEKLANALAEAKRRLDTAASSGPEIARNQLAEAQGLLMQAEPLAVEDQQKKAELVALQVQVEVLFDQLNNVKRPVTTMLAALGAESQPKELIYGVNTLFVWVGDAIYRVDTSQPSTDLLQNEAALLEAAQTLPSGEPINGNPKALAWVTFGNGRPYDAMILLTENGQLIEYERSLEQKKILAGSRFETSTQASEAYNGNLYLLDRTERQIWKYIPDEAGNYINDAVAWIAITDQDNMGRPVDLAIDGYIFLLDEAGQVRRFQGGTLSGGFALQAVEPPLNQGVALAKAPDDKSDLFVADAERIMRFNANGVLVAQYRAPLGTSQRWGQIHDITIHPEGNQLYVLGDNGIYFLDLLNFAPPPELAPAPEPAPDATGPQTEPESEGTDFFEDSGTEAEPAQEAAGEEAGE